MGASRDRAGERAGTGAIERSDESLVLGDNFLRLIERAGRPGQARNEYSLCSAPERKLAAQMTARGDPWLQDEVPRQLSPWSALKRSGYHFAQRKLVRARYSIQSERALAQS